MSIFGFRIPATLRNSYDGQLMSLSRKDRSRERGFTLIEVLIVLAIIGMVASLVGPRVLGYLSDSKVKAARVQIDAFSSALDLFYLDNSRYPTASEGLGALVKKPTNASRWTGPYLRSGEVPRDPWATSMSIGPLDSLALSISCRLALKGGTVPKTSQIIPIS